MSMPSFLTPEDAKRLLDSVDYVLFDIDGVIWSGEHVYYQVPETLYWLASTLGKKIRFVTNNATRTRDATRDEFAVKGMPFVTSEMIYSSAYVAALELKDRWRTRRGAASCKKEGAEAVVGGQANGEGGSVSATTTQNNNNNNGTDATLSTVFDDRFPYNVFVIGEKGLHDELKDVALTPDAMTVGLELNIDPSSPFPLLRSTNYAAILKCMNEAVIPVGVRIQGATWASTASALADGGVQLASIESLNCGAVVVGLDRNVNMLKTSIASLILQRADRWAGKASSSSMCDNDDGTTNTNNDNNNNAVLPCDFIATNEDPSITIGDEGFLFPGAGSVVAMLSTAVGRQPDYVCGKPHQLMARVFMAAEGVVDPSRCLMVGDRLTTDIAFGRAMGAQTLMVLTGAETISDIEAAPEDIRPDFVAPSASSLMFE